MQQQFRSSGVLAIFLLNLVLLARLSRSFVVQAPRLARWHQNEITCASLRTCPLLQSKTSDVDQEKLLQIHKTASDDSLTEVPPELVPVYQLFANQIVTQLQEAFQTGVDQRNARGLNGLPEKAPNAYRILDAACGTGLLWNFLLEAADQRGVKLFITDGVDLSEKMVETGTECAKQVLAKSSQSHTIDVIQSEIIEYCASPSNNANYYHGVIANGCFGYVLDQGQVAYSLSNALLQLDGVLTIFSEQIFRFRGAVDKGYGRGGKKLGVSSESL